MIYQPFQPIKAFLVLFSQRREQIDLLPHRVFDGSSWAQSTCLFTHRVNGCNGGTEGLKKNSYLVLLQPHTADECSFSIYIQPVGTCARTCCKALGLCIHDGNISHQVRSNPHIVFYLLDRLLSQHSYHNQLWLWLHLLPWLYKEGTGFFLTAKKVDCKSRQQYTISAVDDTAVKQTIVFIIHGQRNQETSLLPTIGKMLIK